MEVYSFSSYSSTVRYAAYAQSTARFDMARQKPPDVPGEHPKRQEDRVEIPEAGRAAAKGAAVSMRDDYLFTVSATGFNDSPLVRELRRIISGYDGGIIVFEMQHERTYSAAGREELSAGYGMGETVSVKA